jgi:hypothetical protein
VLVATVAALILLLFAEITPKVSPSFAEPVAHGGTALDLIARHR